MRNHDYLACPGNICVTDPENYLRNWFPDEALCVYRPRPKWLKVQKKIQKLYLQGKMTLDKYFTLNDLEKIHAVRPGIKGRYNPDKLAPVAKKRSSTVRKPEPDNPKRYIEPLVTDELVADRLDRGANG